MEFEPASSNEDHFCVSLLYLSIDLRSISKKSEMAPPPQIRLAVLLCDTPLPQVVAEEGDYHKIYTTLMHDASPGVDFKFVIDAYDVKNKFEYPADDHEYDGIILTGSGRQQWPSASAPS